jgi:hypothetical protein
MPAPTYHRTAFVGKPRPFLAGPNDEAPGPTGVDSLENARRNLSKSRVSASDFIDILGNQKLTRLLTRLAKRSTGL